MLNDSVGFVLVVAGFVIAAAGHLWLLGRAFQASDLVGSILFFLPPLTPLYGLAALRRCWAPLLVFLLGVGLVVAPFGIRAYLFNYIDLGERVKQVNGETHVTLTGWDKKDYSVLEQYKDAAVVQMANADVTDDAVKHLKGMTKLRVLDLNNTENTDAALKVVRDLPALEQLRFANTGVTDAGFRANILPLESLTLVEWSGAEVIPETIKEWKAARAGRKTIPRVK